MEALQKKTTQILLVVIVTLFVVFLIILFTRSVKEVGAEIGLSVTWTEGDVLFSGNGEIWEMADNGTLLPNGYRLRTGKDSKAILNTPKGSYIRLDENTEIQVAQISKQDVLLVQNSGRTYHRVKMAQEDIYQVRALNHTIKAVGTAFDISTNRKANRINAKILEGKLNVAINLGEIIEVQSIGTCSNEDFQFYKVVRSASNTNPSYPNDPVIASSSNRSYSNYIDKTVAPTRTYHYKVCAVQRLNKISCGNKVSVTY